MKDTKYTKYEDIRRDPDLDQRVNNRGFEKELKVKERDSETETYRREFFRNLVEVNESPEAHKGDLFFQKQKEKKDISSANYSSTRDLVFQMSTKKKNDTNDSLSEGGEVEESEDPKSDHTNGHGPYLFHKY